MKKTTLTISAVALDAACADGLVRNVSGETAGPKTSLAGKNVWCE